MGVKDFSKTFTPFRIVKIKDYKDKTLAIDAMTEIWRAAVGAKSIKTLTDASGKPTLHINTVIANIVSNELLDIKSIWVFDYTESDSDSHNPAKLNELANRRRARKKAQDRLDVLFDDTDDEDDVGIIDAEEIKKRQDKKIANGIEIHKMEKRTFVLGTEMIDDIKLVLNCLSIPFICAPKGFEGEHIAALLSNNDIVDAVYSGDTDPIPFGAKVALRRDMKDKKKIYEYRCDDIIQQMNDKIISKDDAGEPVENDFDIDDLRKFCSILGTDYAKRTRGVGPKTIYKKYNSIKLTPNQVISYNQYSKTYDVDKLEIPTTVPFSNKENIIKLLEWLVHERSFDKDRILKSINKVMTKHDNVIKASEIT